MNLILDIGAWEFENSNRGLMRAKGDSLIERRSYPTIHKTLFADKDLSLHFSTVLREEKAPRVTTSSHALHGIEPKASFTKRPSQRRLCVHFLHDII